MPTHATKAIWNKNGTYSGFAGDVVFLRLKKFRIELEEASQSGYSRQCKQQEQPRLLEWFEFRNKKVTNLFYTTYKSQTSS